MNNKLPFLVLYALCGLLLALWPLVLRRPSDASCTASQPSGASGLTPLSQLGVAAGLVVGSVLPWWRHDWGFAFTLSWGEASVLALLTALCLWTLLRPATPVTGKARIPLALAFASAALILSFCTLTFANREVLHTAWHHWGAYIGPTELMLAGARVMHDFPTQYGLGPTALIASVCGRSCWSGTFYVIGLTTFAFSLLIAFIAARVAGPLSRTQWTVVLLLCVACCFFWDAYPPLVASPIATPSVSGMRFLPALALVAFLLVADRPGRRVGKFPYALGHLVWALCALWSVESAFYATCIWWPYYLLLRHDASRGTAVPTLLRGATVLFALLTAWLALFLAGYWLIYQTTPTAMGVFAYIVNPPGPLPVNYSGTIWFFVAVIGLGTWVNLTSFRLQGHTAELRHGMALTLLAYSTFSYFLGRSHDNNVLNLLPFLLLVLLHSWARAPAFGRSLAAGLMAGVLGWLSVFGWGAWNSAARAWAQPWFDAGWIMRAMPGPQGGVDSYPPETQRVIAYTQTLVPGPVTVGGPTANPSTTDAAAVWSALHSPANLYMFAPEVRRDFLYKTAQTLQRSGWLLLWTREPIAMGLVPDFDAAYHRTQSFEMNGYLAIHYAPKPRQAARETTTK